jgi:hypothetical protein
MPRVRPIFTEEIGGDDNKAVNRNIIFPSTTPEELSDSIIELVDGGASIINLSLGLSTSSLMTYGALQEC